MKIRKLEYLFSYNNLVGSKLISWATNHQNQTEYKTPSHVAILVNDFLVIESTMTTGVRLIPYKAWLAKGNKVACSVKCPQKREWQDVMEGVFALWGKKYDYIGIVFFGWHLLKQKLFKKPLPKKNKWESNNRFFCVEIVENITGETYEMTSPVDLMNQFQAFQD